MRTQNLNLRTAPQEMGYLTLVTENSRKTFEVQEYAIIGRETGSQVMIPDASISGRHARIERRPDGYYIRDLRSRNGTFINGTPVLEARLQDRDRVRVGLTELVFTAEKESENQKTVLTSQNLDWDKQLRRLPSIAQSPHPVLLLGPSGTGKEVLANMIHRLSTRSRGPFLSVNCSALTEALAESELFGHIKGSYTGASEDRKGAFEAARGGTLFLDEVGDIPPNLQPKFLRALENSEIKPVGADRTVSTDVRIVAATNRDLRKLVEKGQFREDLYYRLHILQIRPPTLAERREDFDNLLKQFANPLRVRFTAEALAKLKAYSWPGNIRELRNVVSRAAAIFPNMPITENEVEAILDTPPAPEASSTHQSRQLVSREFLKEYEKAAILERLAHYHGNQRRAADDLGMAKSTLHDRIRRYDIDVKELKNQTNT
jgi:transcriptional regulator with GAF, ATPase, and Fis domain